MKKFVFKLEKLYQMKTEEQKNIKLQLQNVDKRIVQVEALRTKLDNEVAAEREKWSKDCANGTNANTLRSYNNYFLQSSAMRQSYDTQLNVLYSKRESMRQRLIRLMNELKVLDEKRNEQYKQYLAELRVSENKEIDSLLSYNVSRTGTDDGAGF